MGRMSVLDEALGGHRVVIDLPTEGIDEWIPIIEVLLLEGIRAVSVPVSRPDLLTDVHALYGRRLRLGASAVVDAAGARAAVDAGAQFLLSPIQDPSVREAAGGVPVLTGALTPVEVGEAASRGEQAVLVAPADVLGSAYARVLPGMFPAVGLVPMGRLERYQCDMWLEAGAAAVVVQDVVVRAGGGSNAVDEVARRAVPFGQLVATFRS